MDSLKEEIVLIKSQIAQLIESAEHLKSRFGWVEEHHGDALTDFGRRVAEVEEKHGQALVALGQRIQELSIAAPAPQQDQPASQIDQSGISLPKGTFLGDIPCRYGSEFGRYQALGGTFEPEGNTISYAYGDRVRFYELSMVFDLIQKDQLKGDIVELGVYKGDTAGLIAQFARRLSRVAYLLDTYDGFDDRDLDKSEQNLSGRFGETSLDYVKERVGTDNTVFVKGYFPETANQLPEDGRYCLVHIDTDLYAPILAGLEYFYPRMVEGGFLVIHDYMSLCWEGAIKAVDEFFTDKPEYIIPVPDLAGTVIVRKCGVPGR